MADRLAIDVAILLTDELRARAEAASRAVRGGSTRGFLLDATHLPHVTLVQAVVRHAALERLEARIDAALRDAPRIDLRIDAATASGPVVHWRIAASAALQALHERLMHGVGELELGAAAPSDFASLDGEEPRTGDLAWVTGYRESASFERFEPHVTLGVGEVPELARPIEFTAARVGICHLGRYCTCRIVLRQWELPLRGAAL